VIRLKLRHQFCGAEVSTCRSVLWPTCPAPALPVLISALLVISKETMRTTGTVLYRIDAIRDACIKGLKAKQHGAPGSMKSVINTEKDIRHFRRRGKLVARSSVCVGHKETIRT